MKKVFKLSVYVFLFLIITFIYNTNTVSASHQLLSNSQTSLYCKYVNNINTNMWQGNKDNIKSQVISLQNFLKSYYNINLSTSGNYGPMTKYYVSKFQKEMGIKPSGGVGPITIAKMKSLCSVTNIDKPSTPDNSGYTCSAYFEGYVFDHSTERCIKRGASGCSNPFKFKTQLECEEGNSITATNTGLGCASEGVTYNNVKKTFYYNEGQQEGCKTFPEIRCTGFGEPKFCQNGRWTQKKTSCEFNGIIYNQGESKTTGGLAFCRNGQWVAQSCQFDGVTYSQGDSRICGNRSSCSGGTFVCIDGEWATAR